MYRLLLQRHGVMGFLAHAQDIAEGAWFDNLRFTYRHVTEISRQRGRYRKFHERLKMCFFLSVLWIKAEFGLLELQVMKDDEGTEEVKV